MNILAIETSTKNFSLAVSDGEKILRRRDVVLKRVLSSSIIPAIDRILADAGLTLSRLDGLAAGLGPGSFTSLRVGLSTVKALAFAAGLPVVGISSLDAIALAAAKKISGSLCVLSDARRDMAFAAQYDARGGVIHRVGEYHLTTIAAWLPRLTGEVVFVGDGVPVFRDAIETFGRSQKSAGSLALIPGFIEQERLWYPRAAELIHLASAEFKADRTADLQSLVPLYLYPEDCQVRR